MLHSYKSTLRRLPLISLMLLPQYALAEGTAAPSPSDVSAGSDPADGVAAQADEIVVVGSRLTGAVEAAQPPLVTLDETDIASYGASSLSELLDAVSPQTGSGRGRGSGRPIILMNGQRISNFREMQGFSPEAIRRMEVLPEEVALKYGYPPNQRVVNFILKDNFSSRTLRGEYKVPTRGGFADSEAQFSMLRIKGPSRFNLNAYVEDTSLLTEAERGIVQPGGAAPTVSSDPNPELFRSLIADSRNFGVSGSWSTGLGDRGMDGSLSANASFARTDSRSLAGLDSFVLTAPPPNGTSALRTLGDPLERISRTDSLEGGAGLNKRLGTWQLSLTVDGGHIVTNTATDRRADVAALTAAAAAGTLAVTGPLPSVANAGVDRARVANDSLTSLLTLAGRTFRLPAGDVSATVKGGFAYTSIASTDSRLTSGTTRLTRGDASAGLNLALPITSRRENVLAGAGDITLNLSAGVNHLSDFGTLTDWSAGVTWGVTEKLSLQASYIVNEAAPSLSDLGSPAIVSLNVPIYDFSRGENALVSVTSGGNPNLLSERQRDLKISANWQLPFAGSNLIVEYFRNRSTNVTSAFPLLTPEIEAAFPGRAVRDASGRLISIDRRPVTFAQTEGERIRWGLNFSGSLGKAASRGQQDGDAMAPPPGGRQGGMRGGGGMGRMMGMMGGGARGGGQGRWNLSVYHTWRITDRVTIAQGGPVLDQLGGDAVSGGGVSRHSLEVEGGLFRKGVGLRLNGTWSAPTKITASGAPGTSDLRFGSVFRLNLRLFSDLGNQKALTDISPFFKGMRVALRVDNIFDSRQKVTDASGATPFSYLPDFLDPKGRMIGIDIRKSF